MNAVLEQISKIGIVPVVKIDNAADALPLAKALCAGGLPCAEVTFRTSAAAEAIKIMTDNFPSMCVGAGTVLNAEQVDAAVAAGAKFIVSPGCAPCNRQGCFCSCRFYLPECVPDNDPFFRNTAQRLR